MLGGFVSNAIELLTFEARADGELVGVKLTHLHAAEVGVVLEALKSGVRVGGDRVVVEEDLSGVEFIGVDLNLVSEGVISHGGLTIIDTLLDVDGDLLGVSLDSHKEVLVDTSLVVSGLTLGEVVGDLVHEAEFSEGDEEIVS